ncbi:MAG: DNA-directed RNA polymerase subunit D [archaeon]
MKAELVKGTPEKITFTITDATPSYMNALRRLATKEVPVMAIDDVEMKKNSSILYDEIIAHRVGLLALTTDLKGYQLLPVDHKGDEFVNNAMVKFVLSAKGPGTVYAKDLKSKDPAIKPVYPKTPIVKLLDDQELQFEAIAILGKGKTHAKWDSGLAWYTQQGTTYTFTLESWGQLPAKDILLAALKMFDEQLDTVIELSKDLDKE